MQLDVCGLSLRLSGSGMCPLRSGEEDRGKSSESQWYLCLGIQDKGSVMESGRWTLCGRRGLDSSKEEDQLLEIGRDSMRYLGFTAMVKGKVRLITLVSPLSIY